MSNPVSVTDDTFQAEVLQADLPVLVDLWAAWCIPCQRLAPALDEMARDYAGKLKIAKLDVDGNPNTAIKYGVQSIPTLLLFKNGQELTRVVGPRSKDHLLQQLRPHLPDLGLTKP
jgi:thioredoxin